MLEAEAVSKKLERLNLEKEKKEEEEKKRQEEDEKKKAEEEEKVKESATDGTKKGGSMKMFKCNCVSMNLHCTSHLALNI